MRASELTHRVYLQRATETQDGFGHPVKSWSNFQHVWAGLEYGGGSEIFTSDRDFTQSPFLLKLRRSKDVMGLRAKDRVLVPTGYTELKNVINATTTVVSVNEDVFPPSDEFVVQVDKELMYVSSKSGTDLTVKRAMYGTTAALHHGGTRVRMMEHADIEAVVHGRYDMTVTAIRQDVAAST